MILNYSRLQQVDVELLREPTPKELNIILGEDDDMTVFDLPEDLIDFTKEEIIEEDYLGFSIRISDYENGIEQKI